MTVKEIKAEANERFTASRYKAMPAYCALFFVIINIAVVTALLCALTASLPIYVSAILWWYGCLLTLLVLALCGPFSYSVADFYLRAYKDKNADASLGFEGFNKYNFVRSALTFLLRFVFTLLLTCLLIVPGVIFAIKTSMSYHLMRANPKMKVFTAFKTSSKVMKGHSMLYFKLIMSFVGMFLLCILSLGAGFIFVMPYFNTCKVIFYKRALQGDVTAYNFQAESEQTASGEGVTAVEAEAEDSVDDTVVSVDTVAVEPVSGDEATVAEKEPAEVTVEPVVMSENTDFGKTEAVEEPQTEQETVAEVVVQVEHAPESKPEVASASKSTTVASEKEEKPSIAKEEQKEKPNGTSMDAIRLRIEQLRKERERKNGRPEPAPRPQRPCPKPKAEEAGRASAEKSEAGRAEIKQIPSIKSNDIYDGFGPEKIEVEIVEED